jgi:hypothetical protein
MKSIFEAKAFAEEQILTFYEKSTTVHTSGIVLVNFECNVLIFGDVESYSNQGHVFNYVYRYGSVQLKLVR